MDTVIGRGNRLLARTILKIISFLLCRLQLLEALLPALEKYNCLLFSKIKPRRSPWVRAFCDLYHPAGPWGNSKFNDNTDITSPKKYNFKSYQIPTIFKQLQKNQAANQGSQVHVALLEALEEYYSKEQWYKAYVKASEEVAAVEVNKPLAERAAIPTAENSLAPAQETEEQGDETVQASNGDKQRDEADDDLPLRRRKRDVEEEKEEQEGEVTRPRTRRRLIAEQSFKDDQDSETEEELSRPRTRQRTKAKKSSKENQASEAEEELFHPPTRRRTKAKDKENQGSEAEEELSHPPTPRRTKARDKENQASVTPESPAHTTSKKDTLEQKRVQLVDLLAKRERASGEKDAISEKIQVQIDKIDEQLLEMILA